MAISFDCPHCGRHFEIDEQYAGKSAQCHSCNTRLQVPSQPQADATGELVLRGSDEASLPVPSAAGPVEVVRRPGASEAASPPSPTAPSRDPQINIQVNVPTSTTPVTAQDGAAAARPSPEGPIESEAMWRDRRAVQNGGVIGICILLLATILVPWDIVGNKVVWSWDVLDGLPNHVQTFIVGEWIAAGLIVLLGCVVQGMPFSILLTGLSAVGMGLLVNAGKGAMPAPAAGQALSQVAAGGHGIQMVALISVLVLHVIGCVRVRVGRSGLVNLFLGVAAAVCAISVGLIFHPTLMEFLKLVEDSSLTEAVTKTGIVLAIAIVAQGFVILAGLLALLNACGVQGQLSGYTRAAVALIRMAVGVVIASAVIIPGIQQHDVLLSLMTALGIVLLISMPLLLLAGVTRILGDVTAAAKKVLTS